MSRKVCVVSTRRPRNGQELNAFRVEHPDRLDQAISAKARVIADGAVDRSRLTIAVLQVNLNLGPECGAVGLGAGQFHLQPVAPVTGVPEQGVVSLVSRSRSAQLDEEVEIAVRVKVSERDAVAFLKVAGLPSSWSRRQIEIRRRS